jgi:glycosyltransferase involved in cell wall biosynthesis
MTQQPLISVIVPMYNDSAFIDIALLSIVKQSYTEFEVIISDDCSEDDSLERARLWVKRDNRFRVIHNKINIGMTRNWNRALAEVNGRYIIKLDADDVMLPKCLEILVNELEYNREIYAVSCRTLSCDNNLESLRHYRGDEAFTFVKMNPQKRYMLSGYEWYVMCFNDIQLWTSNSMMHRRQNLLALGGWDDTWGCASDTDLILRVLETGKNVCHHPYVGSLYRHRPDSVSADYRRHGWLQWESALLHLASLNRYYHKTNSLSLTLRKVWWQHWQRLKSLKKNQSGELSGIPEPYKEKIIALSENISPPPLFVLIEGQIRQQAWYMKQKLAMLFQKYL